MSIHDRRKRMKIQRDELTNKLKLYGKKEGEFKSGENNPRSYLTGEQYKEERRMENPAPRKEFVPEPPELRTRDQEYSQDNWNRGVITKNEMERLHVKLDAVDAKLEFLLKYLEL